MRLPKPTFRLQNWASQSSSSVDAGRLENFTPARPPFLIRATPDVLIWMPTPRLQAYHTNPIVIRCRFRGYSAAQYCAEPTCLAHTAVPGSCGQCYRKNTTDNPTTKDRKIDLRRHFAIAAAHVGNLPIMALTIDSVCRLARHAPVEIIRQFANVLNAIQLSCTTIY